MPASAKAMVDLWRSDLSPKIRSEIDDQAAMLNNQLRLRQGDPAPAAGHGARGGGKISTPTTTIPGGSRRDGTSRSRRPEVRRAAATRPRARPEMNAQATESETPPTPGDGSLDEAEMTPPARSSRAAGRRPGTRPQPGATPPHFDKPFTTQFDEVVEAPKISAIPTSSPGCANCWTSS